MNFKAIATLANAACEISCSTPSRFSPHYLTEKLQRAIEIEVGMDILNRRHDAILSGNEFVWRDGKSYAVTLTELDEDGRDAWRAQKAGMTVEEYLAGIERARKRVQGG